MRNLDALLHHPPSPLQAVDWKVFEKHGLQLFVKRDDLLHPHVSGNKWRKLKHNLIEAQRLGIDRLVTFGGAFSNHITAVAAAGLEFGFSTVGVVSGEVVEPLNPTLNFAQHSGMELVFTSRANMRNKSDIELLELLEIDAQKTLVLPQGGANCHALLGCREIVTETMEQLEQLPDFFITACGTGATLAGIVSGMAESCQAIGVSVLKGDFLKKEVEKLLSECATTTTENWTVLNDFHHGGYAKWTPDLIGFINDFKRETGIQLDPIYTGKVFFAAAKLAENGYFPEGSGIVLVHTGGLQGIAGFNQRFGNLLTI